MERIVTIDEHALLSIRKYYPEFYKTYRRTGYAIVIPDDQTVFVSGSETLMVAMNYSYYVKMKKEFIQNIVVQQELSLLARINLFTKQHYAKRD